MNRIQVQEKLKNSGLLIFTPREFYDVFRKVMPRHKPELLMSLVTNDRLFQINAGAAYAESWALTFFLVETQPRKYAQYLAKTAQRPPFTEYTAAQRIADFTGAFGNDWRMLEARMLRFYQGIGD